MTKNKLKRNYRESLVVYDLLQKTASINVLKDDLLTLRLEKDEVAFFLDLVCVLERKSRRRTLQPVIENYVPVAQSEYEGSLTYSGLNMEKQNVLAYEYGKLKSVTAHVERNFLNSNVIDVRQTRLMSRTPDAYLLKKALRKLRMLKLKYLLMQMISARG